MSNDTDVTFSVDFVQNIDDIPVAYWGDCAGLENPFVDYRFLRALEHSGSVGENTGWMPYHMVLYRRGGSGTQEEAPIVCTPLYLKSHSYGEYVFDHAWADAYMRAGGNYYPKLQSSIPFTPASAPKLIARHPLDDVERKLAQKSAANALKQVTKKLGLSSAHLTFLTENDASVLEDTGYLIRHDQQFHWHNEGYADFEQFLSVLSSRKRKQIRKERRTANETDLKIEMLTGDDIRDEHWDAFFTFYMDTGSRKWGQPYLTKGFFTEVGQTMAERILLVMVKRAGRYVAGALNFIGQDTLYGRQWGCIEQHPCLHFEVCYYRAIDFAIAHGLKTVEAGAQGEHKLARGYAPVITRSAHYLPDPSFTDAVSHFLERERQHVALDQGYLKDHLPFKKGG